MVDFFFFYYLYYWFLYIYNGWVIKVVEYLENDILGYFFILNVMNDNFLIFGFLI